jgi:hypothetical protein
MTDVPSRTTLTSAPLRHRLNVELNAPVPDVWALVGVHERLPEYSAGIARVDVEAGRGARVCHFRPPDGGTDGIVLRELIRWEAPNVGYSTSAETPNDFGLLNDLSIVTVTAAPGGTRFTWEQYYDHPDLPTMRASVGEGIADIGQRLVARFGGRVVEQYVDEPVR